MDDNNLLMIIFAFIVGYSLPGMMKNMCGGRLVEGATESECTANSDCGGTDVCASDKYGNYCSRTEPSQQPPHCANLTTARQDLLPQPIAGTKDKWWYKNHGDCLNLTGKGKKACNGYGGSYLNYCSWYQP